MPDDKQAAIVAVLNRLLEAELAGVVRYTHYSFLVFVSVRRTRLEFDWGCVKDRVHLRL